MLKKTFKSNIHCVFITEHALIVCTKLFWDKTKHTSAIYISSHTSELFYTNINNIFTDLLLNVTYVEKSKDWTWELLNITIGQSLSNFVIKS